MSNNTMLKTLERMGGSKLARYRLHARLMRRPADTVRSNYISRTRHVIL